jgi:hypothetical protein
MVEFNKKVASSSGIIDFELIEVFSKKKFQAYVKSLYERIFRIRNACLLFALKFGKLIKLKNKND